MAVRPVRGTARAQHLSVTVSRSNASTQDRGRRRRAALLAAAAEVIAAEGLQALTHRTVAQRAGLPPATTGYYFPTKDELVEAVLLHHVEGRVGLLATLLAESAEGAGGLGELLDRVAQALVAGRSGVSPVQYEVYLEATRRPVLRDAVTASMDAFADVAAPLLATIGIRDARTAAHAFVVVADGLALHRFSHPLPVEQDVALTRSVLAGVFAAYAFGVDAIVALASDREQ